MKKGNYLTNYRAAVSKEEFLEMFYYRELHNAARIGLFNSGTKSIHITVKDVKTEKSLEHKQDIVTDFKYVVTTKYHGYIKEDVYTLKDVKKMLENYYAEIGFKICNSVIKAMIANDEKNGDSHPSFIFNLEEV